MDCRYGFRTKVTFTYRLLMKYIVFLLISILIGCKTEKTPTETERWQKHAENTTIIRDQFGVPHVYGKTDADAVFGMLYAQCEDDFYRVEQNYIWAIGRLAEVEGEKAIYSDLRARLFMTEAEAIENYENSPQWLKDLCVAFADGINYYLEMHPEVKPRLLERFEPWMPMYFSEGSIGGDIERVSTEKIRSLYQEDIGTVFNESEMESESEEPQGSNGIAIAGDLTASGNAMLLINPHTSFFFRGEVHMVSEEGLNAYGAVTWGQFFIYQGFNEKTGWMHTSSYTDVLDEYIEKTELRDGKLFYQYGDEWRAVETTEVSLKYREGTQIKERSFPMYRTHHGPVTHKAGSELVATAMMWEPSKALMQSYQRTKQNNYEGFREMMDIRTNSSNNTVYADADGNIAYFHGNFIPVRDTLFDFSQPVDGSIPDTDWKGLHTVDENILILNPANGWIQNCNSTPYTAAEEYSPKREDYPSYMSLDRENFRGVHAIELLQDINGFTLDSLVRLAHDPYLPAFKTLIPGLIDAYDKSASRYPALKEPINILRSWDYRTSEESVAMSMAHYYGTKYLQTGNRPEVMSEMELLTYYGKDSPELERLEIFQKTVEQLEADFGNWNTPWGDINRYQRLNGDIFQAFNDELPSVPIGFASGRWGALAAYGARYHNNTKKIYGTRGNSFVAVVEFGPKVKALSILAGGQSGDPESPHFDDQTERYANVDFKEVSYYREDVLQNAVSTYHPGEELE